MVLFGVGGLKFLCPKILFSDRLSIRKEKRGQGSHATVQRHCITFDVYFTDFYKQHPGRLWTSFFSLYRSSIYLPSCVLTDAFGGFVFLP